PLAWERNPDPEPAFRPVFQLDIAAMAAHHRPRDGETKAGTTGIPIARGLDAVERAEDRFDFRWRNPRTVVVDFDPAFLRRSRHRDPRRLAELHRILDQIGERPLHRDRLNFDRGRLRRLDPDRDRLQPLAAI